MAIDIFSLMKRENAEEESIKEQLLEVEMQLRSAKSKFSEVCDIDLSEAYIFEINALNARYRYLLKCARGEVTA